MNTSEIEPAKGFSAQLEGCSAPRAVLLNDIPADRYTILSSVGRIPRAGDLVVLDQGFTAADGRAMVLVYFPDVGPLSLYEAEAYESELE